MISIGRLSSVKRPDHVDPPGQLLVGDDQREAAEQEPNLDADKRNEVVHAEAPNRFLDSALS